jgi:isoquinoline 1-oxidoreductase beta subunit
MIAPGGSDRRTFVRVSVLVGGGLLLAVGTAPAGEAESSVANATAFAPNAFLRVDTTGVITCVVGRQEMGQGIRSGLPRIVAAEMDADWSRIRLEQGDLDAALGDQYAGGSNSTQHDFARLRQAGAAARWLLLEAAADAWQVPVDSLRTEIGVVMHTSGRRAAYGDLASAAAALAARRPEFLTEAATAPLRDLRELPYLGRRMRQLDVPDIVTGRIRFGLDVRVAGMRVAVVARSPTLGARVRAVDDRAARAVPGVSAIVAIDADALPDLGENSPKPPNGVAVVADSTWTALRARERLGVDWTAGPGAAESTAVLSARAHRLAQQPPERVKRHDGDVDAALRGAVRALDVTYEQPLVAHAQMEPVSCTAWCQADRCELWAPTQDPAAARHAVAKVTGLKPAQITVHPLRMGGGFGRRYYHDMVVEAVLVSRAAGAPVQVVWTREDDMRHGFYRPGALHRLRGGLDSRGRPVAWETHLVNASRGEFLRWALPPGVTAFLAGADLGSSRTSGYRRARSRRPFREASGAPSKRRPTCSRRRASSMSWRISPRAIRWRCSSSCSARRDGLRTTTTLRIRGTRAAWRGCCAWPPNAPDGARPCPPDAAVASPAATPTKRMPRWWRRWRWTANASASCATSAQWTAGS